MYIVDDNAYDTTIRRVSASTGIIEKVVGPGVQEQCDRLGNNVYPGGGDCLPANCSEVALSTLCNACSSDSILRAIAVVREPAGGPPALYFSGIGSTVRRVDPATGVAKIMTGGGFTTLDSTDDGPVQPALLVKTGNAQALAYAPGAGLYIGNADAYNSLLMLLAPGDTQAAAPTPLANAGRGRHRRLAEVAPRAACTIGTISTLAGLLSPAGYIGDGGDALYSGFEGPTAMAVDPWVRELGRARGTDIAAMQCQHYCCCL